MKSVLISIQPYYVFLIIARIMGWNIPQKKTIEVRKSFPKDSTWDNRVQIYCGRNRKSFKRIPAQYQPLMEKFLGRVIGVFVCDEVMRFTKYVGWLSDIQNYEISYDHLKETCLDGIWQYGKGKPLYGWHISDLKIYDKPKELGEFRTPCKVPIRVTCSGCGYASTYMEYCTRPCITRPPQSWCYVEELK